MLVKLADRCYRHRRLVVILWIAALAAVFALSSSFGGEAKQDYLQPGSESRAASETLRATFPQRAGDTVQVVLRSEDGFSSAAVRARAEAIVADVAADPRAAAIAGHLVALAHGFGLRVVGQGTHDAAVLGALATLGCDAVQGSELAPAMPADEFVTWLRARPADRPRPASRPVPAPARRVSAQVVH